MARMRPHKAAGAVAHPPPRGRAQARPVAHPPPERSRNHLDSGATAYVSSGSGRHGQSACVQYQTPTVGVVQPNRHSRTRPARACRRGRSGNQPGRREPPRSGAALTQRPTVLNRDRIRPVQLATTHVAHPLRPLRRELHHLHAGLRQNRRTPRLPVAIRVQHQNTTTASVERHHHHLSPALRPVSRRVGCSVSHVPLSRFQRLPQPIRHR